MPTQPKVSILVPIFNVEKYLHECLDSIVNQTLKDIEIICIDDGSTDTSPQIIKEYADKDPRFIVITKKNSGYGDSMNKGLAKATGEYIGIVESDDFVDKDMFKDLYKLAKKNSAEVVKSNYYEYHTHLDQQSPHWNEELQVVFNINTRKVVTKQSNKCDLVRGNKLLQVVDPSSDQHIFYQKPAIWSAIYQRDFLTTNKIKFLPTPGASYQDTGFNFKVWASASRAVFTDKAYLYYRQDNESSSVHAPGKVFCVADEYHSIEDFLRKAKKFDKFGSLIQKTKYGAYSWNFKRLSDNLDKDFLDLFSKEYAEAERSGYLDYSYFDTNERRTLREIIADPGMALARKRAKNSAKVSIIVPVYNVEEYLADCLDSLLAQSLKDIEIICINDGSTDGSPEILDEYYKSDPRIVIGTHAKNQNVSAARNYALRLVSAPYFMSCDSDDTYHVDMCKKMLTAIEKNQTDMAVCRINVIYSTVDSKGYKNSDDEYFKLSYKGVTQTSDLVISRTDVSPCNKIFKTLIQRKYEIWYPHGMWYEDAMFFYNYAVSTDSIYFLDGKEKLYNYVRRDGSIMSQTARKSPKALDHTRVAIEVFQYMKKHGFLEDRKDLFVSKFISSYNFSKQHSPTENLPDLQWLVWTFLDRNRTYLDSIDPSIARKISALAPKKSIPHRIKSRIKHTAKKTLSTVSINHRRQNQTIHKLDQLSARVSDIEHTQVEILKLLKDLSKR